jgi:cyclopropane-fatty-acyl-phospholipid synthase
VSTTLVGLAERSVLPDGVIRQGIRRRVAQTLRELNEGTPAERMERKQRFIEEMRESPIAIAIGEANEQHYELPPEFFRRVLGRHRKYSGCYWPEGATTLDEAEEAALEQVARRAEIADGMTVLDMGCGWGSASLFLLRRFPRLRVVSVSGSSAQRATILERASSLDVGDRLRVITADMNVFDTDERFDRIVSLEMFEHMRNWEKLLARMDGWLAPGGKAFIHVFAHREHAYPYLHEGEDDWMGRHFFTGGIMPSDDLFSYFQRDLLVERRWVVPGTHYQKTADAWLAELDRARGELKPLFVETYGSADAELWLQRWRIFFMSCAELFGFRHGEEWWISHTLLRKREPRG